MRRLRFNLALIGVLAVGAVGPAAAQKWPEKPITVIMGFPAGSGVDVIARLLQAPLEKDLGTQLVFDYKVGAGGNVASEVVAKARPDGYTILLGTSATHGVNAALYKKLPFDVEADFTPIVPLNDVSNVLTINPAVIDASTVADFIAKVKAAPAKYNFASTGNGTGTHLAFAQFVKMAGLDMVHVPYKGGPEALQAVVTGEGCRRCSANGAPARCACSGSRPSSVSAPSRRCRPSTRRACPATRATSGSVCSARRGSTGRLPRRSTSP
jgi:tripartite-type tricarboxylate transporter receptor subunit TctC